MIFGSERHRSDICRNIMETNSNYLSKKNINNIIILVILLCLIFIYLHEAWFFRAYINDDAYITFRYGRFIAMGRGPNFNVGERVEGYTNFLLMMIMTAVIWISGPGFVLTVSKTINVFCGAASLAAAYLVYIILFEKRSKVEIDGYKTAVSPPASVKLWGLIAVGLVAINPSYALNAESGLETMLFGFLTTMAVLMGTLETRHEKLRFSGIFFGAAALARPEGIYLFSVYWAADFSTNLLFLTGNTGKNDERKFIERLLNNNRLRIMIVNGFIASLIIISQIVFRYFYYDGELLPNTYYAKLGGFPGMSASAYIRAGIVDSFFGIGGIIVALMGYLTARIDYRAVIPAMTTTLAACALPFITGTDWMLGYRLLMPYLPMAAVMIAAGWMLCIERVFGRHSRIGLIAVFLSIPALWFMQSGIRAQYYDDIMLHARGYITGHEALAQWLLDGRIGKGDSIALMDIGTVGYRLIDLNIIDITGLTDRHIAKSKGYFMNKSYDPNYILNKNPKYIVLVLSAPGISYTAPPPDLLFHFWTGIEQNIFYNRQFQEHYICGKPNSAKYNSNWLDEMAYKIGAEKIFEFGYPDVYYLLAAFRYDPTSCRNR